MTTLNIASKPSSLACAKPLAARRRQAGVSVVELLVAMAVGGLVIVAAVGVTISSQRLFGTDQARTNINQNLRSALDLIGDDVRVAGQRLVGSGLSPIRIFVDDDGNHNLEIRRSMVPAVLPLCNTSNEPIRAGNAANLTVGMPNGTGNCNADDNRPLLAMWEDYRINNGGCVMAYIVQPGQPGEFFSYRGESPQANGAINLNHTRGSGSSCAHANNGSWQNDYTKDARMHILEMRRYVLNTETNTLELIINEDVANPLRLVNDITDFEVSAILNDDTSTNDFEAPFNWGRLAAVEVNITGEGQAGQNVITRSLSSRFFPRNILSN